MDKLEHYRDIIERELTVIVEKADDSPIGPAGLRDKTVFNRRSGSYLILREGWDGPRHIHGPVVSLEIINGKVWLQADHTNLRSWEKRSASMARLSPSSAQLHRSFTPGWNSATRLI